MLRRWSFVPHMLPVPLGCSWAISSVVGAISVFIIGLICVLLNKSIITCVVKRMIPQEHKRHIGIAVRLIRTPSTTSKRVTGQRRPTTAPHRTRINCIMKKCERTRADGDARSQVRTHTHAHTHTQSQGMVCTKITINVPKLFYFKCDASKLWNIINEQWSLACSQCTARCSWKEMHRENGKENGIVAVPATAAREEK